MLALKYKYQRVFINSIDFSFGWKKIYDHPNTLALTDKQTLMMSGIKLGQMILIKSLEQKQYFEIKSKALMEVFDLQKTKEINDAFEAVTCSRMTKDGSDSVEYLKDTGEVSLI